MQACLDAPGFFDKVAASMATQPEPLFFAFYYQTVRRTPADWRAWLALCIDACAKWTAVCAANQAVAYSARCAGWCGAVCVVIRGGSETLGLCMRAGHHAAAGGCRGPAQPELALPHRAQDLVPVAVFAPCHAAGTLSCTCELCSALLFYGCERTCDTSTRLAKVGLQCKML